MTRELTPADLPAHAAAATPRSAWSSVPHAALLVYTTCLTREQNVEVGAGYRQRGQCGRGCGARRSTVGAGAGPGRKQEQATVGYLQGCLTVAGNLAVSKPNGARRGSCERAGGGASEHVGVFVEAAGRHGVLAVGGLLEVQRQRVVLHLQRVHFLLESL